MFFRRPVIGVTLDSEAPGGYSKMPWYAIREGYCIAVAEAGGVAIPLPHQSDHIDDYLRLVDGIIITGGNFDIDPNLYDESFVHPKTSTKPHRTTFEYALLKKAYHQNKAILGICGGMQLLNVILGGTLIQHIPDSIPNCLSHEQPNPPTEAGHTVNIVPDTFLHHIIKDTTIPVNSSHHQAIQSIAPALKMNAHASDGVIEGIEDPTHKFCLGVQWHPEFHISSADRQIFDALIAHA